MQVPQPGNLVSINKEVDGVIINGNTGASGIRWALVKVMPDQNGLVLETYDPAALSSTKVAKAADKMLQAQQEKILSKRPPYNNVPEEIHILVLTIGENIVEVVYDPELMSILSL